jgi:hypothetical protein
LRKEENTIRIRNKRKRKNEKCNFISNYFIIIACAGKFDAKKLDLRKDCTGNETNKTLSDMFL